jgi:hypothetical protein
MSLAMVCGPAGAVELLDDDEEPAGGLDDIDIEADMEADTIAEDELEDDVPPPPLPEQPANASATIRRGARRRGRAAMAQHAPALG